MISLRTKVARSFLCRNVARQAGQHFGRPSLAASCVLVSLPVDSAHGCVRGIQTEAQTDESIPGIVEKENFLNLVNKDESLRNEMAYSLSFAESGSVKDSLAFSKLPNSRMLEQLASTRRMVAPPRMERALFDSRPLPRTLEDALRPSNRSIVITETAMPFKIVDVNKAWEGLCGYSFVECQGKTLGSLLRGPETDQSAVTALVSQLLGGEEAGTVLTNYKKDGSKFRNHLRVGPLIEDGKISHFVGVLQEIH